MTALAATRTTIEVHGTLYSLPCAAVLIYQGALVAINASGFATKGAAATTLKQFGRAEETVDNSGGNAGDKSINVKTGVFLWANSTSGDLITRAEIGSDCYIVDDQTVAKTNGSNTRSRAGKVVFVDAAGVYVAMGPSV